VFMYWPIHKQYCRLKPAMQKRLEAGTGSRGKPLGCLQKGNPGIAVWTKW